MPITRALILFLALLITQFIVSADLQHTYVGYVISLGPILIFSGLGLGQLLYIVLERRPSWRSFMVRDEFLATVILLGFISIGQTQSYTWIPVFAIFVVFGLSISEVYRSLAVPLVVRSATMAGFLIGIFILPIAKVDTLWLKVGIVLLLLPRWILKQTEFKNFRALAVWFLIVSSLFLLYSPLPPRAISAEYVENFKYSGTSYFAPFIRTDIYANLEEDTEWIVTNGTRSAQIPTVDSNHLSFRSLVPPNSTRALIIGPAGGVNVERLLMTDIKEIYAVDLNPNVFRLALEHPNKRVRDVYSDPRVKAVAAEGRHFLDRVRNVYDLIFIQVVVTSSANGVLGDQFESFLYTREAIEKMWEQLAPNGLIYIELQDNKKGGVESIGEQLANTLACSPLFQDENRFYFRSTRVGDAQIRKGSKKNNGIVLSKGKFDPANLDRLNKRRIFEVRNISASQDCDQIVTDDRPVLIFSKSSKLWLILSGGLIALAGIFTRYRYGRITKLPILAVSAGASYMIWMTCISSFLFLIFDNPAAVPAVVILISFLCGFGCFQLDLSRKFLRALGVVFLVTTMVIIYARPALNGLLQSLDLNLALLWVLILIPSFVLIELPYMQLLKHSMKPLDVVTFENIGSVLGIVIVIASKSVFGNSGLLAASAFFSLLILIFVGNTRAGGHEA